MSTIICGLGLKQVNTGPGKATFTHGIVTQLAAAVTEAAAKLPTTKEELLEAASDYDYTPLQEDVAHLLCRFGDEIWGAERERTWLLQARESKVGYHKDLVFEDAADQVVLMYYLRLWILVKAFNTLRNRAYANARAAVQASTGSWTIQDSENFQVPETQSSVVPIPAKDIRGSYKIPQAHTRGDIDTLAADPTVNCLDSAALAVSTQEQIVPSDNNGGCVRRTTRVPKPRKQDDALTTSMFYLDSDQERHSEVNIDSIYEGPRHYKGKGRAWRKVNTYEDAAFELKEPPKTSYRPNHAPPTSKPTDRPGNKSLSGMVNSNEESEATTDSPNAVLSISASTKRPKSSLRKKSVLSEEYVRDEEYDLEDTLACATIYTVSGRRSGRLRKETSTNLAPTAGPAQECINDDGGHEAPKRRRKRRRSRKFLSEEVIRNSSDESEDSHIPNDTSFINQRHDDKHGAVVTATEKNAQDLPVLLSPPATNTSTMPRNWRQLPLDKYWDEDTWKYVYNCDRKAKYIHQTMLSLGLRVGHTGNFLMSEDARVLDKDIRTIAAKVTAEHSIDKLLGHAADSNSLNEDIDLLFYRHSSIWSIGGDRSQLSSPGVEYYPRDLYYEESEDQRLLWIHLHRWIFVRALVDLDNKGEKCSKDVPAALQLESAKTSTARTQAATSLTNSLTSGSAPNSSNTSSIVETPGQIQKHMAYNNIDSGRTIDGQVSRKHKRGRPPTNGVDLSALFMSYLEVYDNTGFDELTALKNMTTEMSLLKPYANIVLKRLDKQLATLFFTLTFDAWVEYRRTIVHIKRKSASTQSSGQPLNHQVDVIDRSRRVDILRQAHQMFTTAGHDGLRPEIIIARAMVLLSGLQPTQEMRIKMRTGFESMEEELQQLGDRLVERGGDWILGHAEPVSSVLAMFPRDDVSLWR